MRNDDGPDNSLFLRSTENGKACQYMIDNQNSACTMTIL